MTSKIKIFSVLGIKWTQMEMTQNQIFCHETYSNLTSFSLGCKILKYLNDWICIFQFYCKSEHKQVKWNKIKPDMWKSNSIVPCLQSITLFKMTFEIYFLINFIMFKMNGITFKMNDNSSKGKNLIRSISFCKY